MKKRVTSFFRTGLLAGLFLHAGAGSAKEIPREVIDNARNFALSNYVAQLGIAQTNRVSADVTAHFARACYERAEWVTNKAERVLIAEQGIEAAERALKRQSNSALAWYSLGLNLGQLARTKTLGALPLVDRMVTAFRQATVWDSRLEYAGPDRSLGILHRDAPSFGSVGSRRKARQHLERAVRLEPGYPGNPLALAESCFKWGDTVTAGRQIMALEQIWDAARRKLVGPDWELTWCEWEQRLSELKTKLAKLRQRNAR